MIHRNYPIFKVADHPPPRESWHAQTLYGPLCTSIDLLANQLPLASLRRGDLLAIASSGAYGVSASPIHFISHPPPREVLVQHSETELEYVDVSAAKGSTATATSVLKL